MIVVDAAITLLVAIAAVCIVATVALVLGGFFGLLFAALDVALLRIARRVGG
jgi:hypothetical protein